MSEISRGLQGVLWAKLSNVPLIIPPSQYRFRGVNLFEHPLTGNALNRCLGIEDKKGTLRPGAHADLVVLDRQGIVLSTWVKGTEVWVKGA